MREQKQEFGNAVKVREFRQLLDSLYGGKGTGKAAGSSNSLWDGVASLASEISEPSQHGGKLSEHGLAMVGASYRAKRKGRTVPASVHALAALGDELPAFARADDSTGKGRGQGACLVSLACLDHLPLSVGLGSMFQAAGPLLHAAQGQGDLALAKRQAAKLLGTMRRAGATPSNATEGDAIGDGALALVRWRNTYGPRLLNESAPGVCWRACVASVARADMLGESIDVWRADDSGAACWDWLCASALPLPQLVGDGSHWERASRLRFERARAGRLARLARRFAPVTLRAKGRQVQAANKVHRAIIQLLHGASLDDAARAAGFNASTVKHGPKAGDRLLRAAKRLGFRFQRDARDTERKAASCPAPFVPMSSAIPAAWRATPSASLDF